MKVGLICQSLFLSIIGLALNGCGGSDGGATATTATPSFGLAKAFSESVKSGYSTAVNVAQFGTTNCVGTGTVTVSPATPTQFNKTLDQQVPALSYDTNYSWTWQNCMQASGTKSFTTYLNPDDFALLGVRSETTYGVYQSLSTYPNQIQVGKAGDLSRMDLYADATLATIVGTADSSYRAIAGIGSTTMHIAFTTLLHDLNGTQNERWINYRQLGSDGKFTYLSDEISYPLAGDVINFIAK